MCSIETTSSPSSVPISLSSLFNRPSGIVTLEDRPRSPQQNSHGLHRAAEIRYSTTPTRRKNFYRSG
ncbi:unnamed protein product [Penicillium viridicatum]